jgi:hypothetical protein
MSRKEELIADLRAVFDGWESLLAGKDEDEIAARPRPEERSISDVIGHLRAWQQVSTARLEAALLDTDPDFPAWLGRADPFFAEDHVDDFNARIHEINHGWSWLSLYRDWRQGFLRLLELAEAIPDADMLYAERYPWLRGHALSAVLEGSCEHHREHLEQFSAPEG